MIKVWGWQKTEVALKGMNENNNVTIYSENDYFLRLRVDDRNAPEELPHEIIWQVVESEIESKEVLSMKLFNADSLKNDNKTVYVPSSTFDAGERAVIKVSVNNSEPKLVEIKVKQRSLIAKIEGINNRMIGKADELTLSAA